MENLLISCKYDLSESVLHSLDVSSDEKRRGIRLEDLDADCIRRGIGCESLDCLVEKQIVSPAGFKTTLIEAGNFSKPSSEFKLVSYTFRRKGLNVLLKELPVKLLSDIWYGRYGQNYISREGLSVMIEYSGENIVDGLNELKRVSEIINADYTAAKNRRDS